MPPISHSDRSSGRSLANLRPTILLIDTEDWTRRLLRGLLENEYAVLEATSLAAGIDLNEKARPQVVILDLSLGQDHGIDFLFHLHQTHRKLPVVLVLSSENSPAASQEALSLGASAFLVKPFVPEHLVLALKNHLYSQQRAAQPLRKLTDRIFLGQSQPERRD